MLFRGGEVLIVRIRLAYVFSENKSSSLNGSIRNNVLREIQVSEIFRNNAKDMTIYGLWGPFLRMGVRETIVFRFL